MLVPPYSKNQEYKISLQTSIVFFEDSTAGADFHQLRRVIYGNLLQDFDNSFVKNYKFGKNANYQTEDENIVQLWFKQNKYNDDIGYIVIDTAKNVILEFERTSGLRVNKKKNITSGGRTAEKMNNFVRNSWDTYIYGKFEQTNSGYQMTECKYQVHWKNTHKGNVYTYHSEAFLTLKETEESQNMKWLIFPKVVYSIIIFTKEMRLIEEALQNLPRTYGKF